MPVTVAAAYLQLGRPKIVIIMPCAILANLPAIKSGWPFVVLPDAKRPTHIVVSRGTQTTLAVLLEFWLHLPTSSGIYRNAVKGLIFKTL